MPNTIAGRDALTLHSATQVPGIVRDALSAALDMPGHQIRVVAPDVGGGFGGKGSLYPEEIFVCAAARRLARPVKWTSDRMEDLTCNSQGFDEIIEAELGLNGDGRVVALRADVIGDVGAYSIYPWTAALEPVQVVSFLPGPYRIEHYRGRVRAVATSKAPTGPYRGVGRPTSTFVMERLMDMAATKLGLDAKEIRLRNLVGAGEFPYKVASGIVWDKSGFQECLNAACDAIGYDALRVAQREARAKGRWFGIGVASYAELTGIGSRISVAPGMPINTGTETANIRIEFDRRDHCRFRRRLARTGTGNDTGADRCRAPRRMLRGCPHRAGRQCRRAWRHRHLCQPEPVLAGGAATLAARSVREKVLNAASHLLEASAADLVAEEGKVSIAGTDRSVTFREVARGGLF